MDTLVNVLVGGLWLIMVGAIVERIWPGRGVRLFVSLIAGIVVAGGAAMVLLAAWLLSR